MTIYPVDINNGWVGGCWYWVKKKFFYNLFSITYFHFNFLKLRRASEKTPLRVGVHISVYFKLLKKKQKVFFFTTLIYSKVKY